MGRFAQYLPKEEKKEPLRNIILMSCALFFLLSWAVLYFFGASIAATIPYCEVDPFECSGFVGGIVEAYIAFFVADFFVALAPALTFLAIYGSIIFVIYKAYGFLFKRKSEEGFRFINAGHWWKQYRDIAAWIIGGIVITLFTLLFLFKTQIVNGMPSCYFSDVTEGAAEVVRCHGKGNVLLEMVFGLFPWAIIKIKPQLLFVQFVYFSIGYLFYRGFKIVQYIRTAT